MLRLLLLSLLVCAAPLAAQAVERPAALRSGTPVRVFLPGGPPDGRPAVLVGSRADTLLVASPALGLAHLSAGEMERLETAGAPGGRIGTYVIRVLALSGALVILAGGEPLSMFMNGVVIFGIGGGIAYALEPPRRPIVVDPAHGLPEVLQNPARPGVPARVATASQPRTTYLLHDFSPDSVYLFAEGRSIPLARAEIRSLQVSPGRDRRRGARLGGQLGALAGAVAGALWAFDPDGGAWVLVAAPVPVLVGGLFGWAVGAPAGWALAPRRWMDVPVLPREP